MDKILRLLASGGLAWAGLSAYLSGGENLWVGLSATEDWQGPGGPGRLPGGALSPTLAGAGGLPQLLQSLFLRLLIVAAPAYAAMTGAVAVREGVSDVRVGVAVAGLVAAVLAWRQLGAAARKQQATGGPVTTPAALASHASMRKALESMAKAHGLPGPSSERDVRLRYVARDGSLQFVDVPPRSA
jgi:hypothetical protein